jgi:hypothetical protein
VPRGAVGPLVTSERAFTPQGQIGGNADKPAVGAKFQRSGLVLIAAFEAKSEKCQRATLGPGSAQKIPPHYHAILRSKGDMYPVRFPETSATLHFIHRSRITTAPKLPSLTSCLI